MCVCVCVCVCILYILQHSSIGIKNIFSTSIETLSGSVNVFKVTRCCVPQYETCSIMLYSSTLIISLHTMGMFKKICQYSKAYNLL